MTWELEGGPRPETNWHFFSSLPTVAAMTDPDAMVGPDGPRLDDALGATLLAALDDPEACEIVERDDGLIMANRAVRYLDPVDVWPAHIRHGLDRVTGRVLDIGAGAGRAAVPLLERGHRVTALDVSPGAIEACRRRGVTEVFLGPVDEHARSGERYDTFLLYGNNLGLLANATRAPEFLTALAAMAAPGARIVGQGMDPYGTTAERNLRYHERNRQRGRMAGQLSLRIRYEDTATPWFDYLFASPDELLRLVAGTGWRIDSFDDSEAPSYLAVLVQE